MYLPKQFEETSIPVLLSLIKAHPLATVITLSTSGLNANHIPMVVAENADATMVLRGHVARANPMLADLAVSAQTLLVFQGAEHYITPSWYATKKETEKVVLERVEILQPMLELSQRAPMPTTAAARTRGREGWLA